jgi:hypothetical protein
VGNLTSNSVKQSLIAEAKITMEEAASHRSSVVQASEKDKADKYQTSQAVESPDAESVTSFINRLDLLGSKSSFDVIKLHEQVRLGFERRNRDVVNEIFERYSTTPLGKEKQHGSKHSSYLSKSQLFPLLKELGVNITEIESEELFDEFDYCDNQGLNLQELQLLLQKPCRLHEWAMGLPLYELLADAMPRKPGMDPLRVVSTLTSEEIVAVCEVVRNGLARMLKESSELLFKAFLISDKRSKESFSDGSKFSLQSMSCGNIDDFHKGIEARIGERLDSRISFNVYYLMPQG